MTDTSSSSETEEDKTEEELLEQENSSAIQFQSTPPSTMTIASAIRSNYLFILSFAISAIVFHALFDHEIRRAGSKGGHAADTAKISFRFMQEVDPVDEENKMRAEYKRRLEGLKPKIRERDRHLLSRDLQQQHYVLMHHPYKTGGHRLCRWAHQNGEVLRNQINYQAVARTKFFYTNEDRIMPRWDKLTAALAARETKDAGPISTPNHVRTYIEEYEKEWTCGELQTRLFDTNSTFAIQEYYVSLLPNCSFPEAKKIVTIATVREPVSRMASHAHQMMRHYSSTQQYSSITPEAITTLRSFDSMADNHQVRAIIKKPGPDFLKTNKRPEKLTQDDMKLALSLLDNVDIVIPAERLCEAGPIFERLFGWKIDHTCHTDFDMDCSFRTFEHQFYDDVLRMNTFDLELWRTANQRFDSLLMAVGQKPRKNSDCAPIKFTIVPFRKVFDKSNVRHKDGLLACSPHAISEGIYDTKERR